MSRTVAGPGRVIPGLQPDFGSHFHLAAPRPIRYCLRPDSNRAHDLVYLESYIHDARFRPTAVRVRGTTLTIDLKRDAWELYQQTGRLKSVRSRLTVQPVARIEWQLEGPLAASKSDFRREELDITHLFFGEACWLDAERSEIILANPSSAFRLRVHVSGKDFTIVLKDAKHPPKRES